MTRWVLYDDPASRCLRPFTWLRPASSLLLGAHTVEERWRRLVPEDAVEVACRPSLAPLQPGRLDLASLLRPSVTAGTGDGASNEEIWVSSLLVPDAAAVEGLRSLAEETTAQAEGVLVAFRPGEKMRRLLAGGGAREGTWEGSLAELGSAGFPAREAPYTRLSGLADLVTVHERLLPGDLERLLHETPAAFSPGDGYAYRPDAVRLGEGCRVDHGAVLDARNGPILLGPGCEVAPHTWIQGPIFAGAGCRFLGGRIGEGSSFGPGCRVHGEVEESVFLGFDNKAHDGFVGHSYLAEWINLGAMTTTSDLKNNYSFVTLEPEGEKVPTRLRKLGVFLGDHVKTRIGSLLTCGTIVGVGANLIGDPAVGKKFVADFLWGSGADAAEYAINKFLQTAEITYGRRSVNWTPAVAESLREVHAATERTRRAQLGVRGAGTESGPKTKATKSDQEG